jgi:hypothetical protein
LVDKQLPQEYTPVDYEDLPSSVINRPDWPVKGQKTTKAIVIPYNKVQSAKMPWWGALTVEASGFKFKLKVFLKRKAIREFLERGGLIVQ